MKHGMGSVLVLEPDEKRREEILNQIKPLIGDRSIYTTIHGVRRPDPDIVFHIDLEDPQLAHNATEMVIGSSEVIKPFAAELFRISGISVFPYIPPNVGIGYAWDANERDLVEMLTPGGSAPKPELWANPYSAVQQLGSLCRERTFLAPEGPLDLETNTYTGAHSVLFDDSGITCRPDDIDTKFCNFYGFEDALLGHCVDTFVRTARMRPNRWVGLGKSAIQNLDRHNEGAAIDYWAHLSKLAYDKLLAVSWFGGEPILFPTNELLERRDNK